MPPLKGEVSRRSGTERSARRAASPAGNENPPEAPPDRREGIPPQGIRSAGGTLKRQGLCQKHKPCRYYNRPGEFRSCGSDQGAALDLQAFEKA